MNDEKKYKKALLELSKQIVKFEKELEKLMLSKESYERGKNIALLLNQLTNANKSVLYFTFNYGWKKIENFYKRNA